MQTTDTDTKVGRDEHLVAAAEALRAWVQERRATWPQTSARQASTGGAPSAVSPAGSARPDRDRASAKSSFSILPAQAPAAAEETLPGSGSVGTGTSGLGYWGLRGAIAAAVVAIVGVTGWKVMKVPAGSRTPVPTTGTAVLESVPTGSTVFIDGAEAGGTPLVTELRPGHHTVEFHRRSATRSLDITVVAGRSVVGHLDWIGKRPGTLEVLSDPDGAAVIVDDDVLGVTPLVVDDLRPGSHKVVLTGLRGSIQRTIDIGPDKVSQITEATRSGWMHVSAPIEIDVAEGTKPIRLDDQNQVLLSAGLHELKFDNVDLGYHDRRRVDVKAGAITSVSIAPPGAPLTVSASLPSEVFIDGQRLGAAPITNHYVDLGPHIVTVKSAAGEERRLPITTTVNPSRLDVDFSHP